MLALIFRKGNGELVSEALLAAIHGSVQAQYGYTAELVEVPANKGGSMQRFLSLLVLVLVLAVGAVAFAQSPASLPSDAAGIVAFFKQTHDSKEWGLFIGGVITLLVRLLTLLKPLAEKLPPEHTKWLAMGLAMLGSIATGLLASVPWYKVLVDGAQTGAAALGGWEFILKPLLAKLGLSTAPTGGVKAAAPAT